MACIVVLSLVTTVVPSQVALARSMVPQSADDNWNALGDVVFGFQGSVGAIVRSGDNLVVGGTFAFRNPGETAYHFNLGRWHIPTQTWYPLIPDGYLSVGVISALATNGPLVYVADQDTNSTIIHEWNSRTDVWRVIGTTTSGTADSMAVVGSRLFISGNLQAINGVTVKHIAAWDGSNWDALDGGLYFSRTGYYESVSSMAVVGNDLYVNGSFDRAGSMTVDSFARYDTVAGTWNAAPTITVQIAGQTAARRPYQLAAGPSSLYAATSGVFETGHEIYRYNGSAWSLIGMTSGSPSSTCGYGITRPYVFTMTVIGSSLYIGGCFTQVSQIDLATSKSYGLVNASNVARFDGSAWSALGSGLTGRVTESASYGTDLYMSGTIDTAGGKKIYGVARWHGNDVLPPAAPDRQALLDAYGQLRSATADALIADLNTVADIIAKGTHALDLSDKDIARMYWFFVTGAGRLAPGLRQLVGPGGLSYLQRSEKFRNELVGAGRSLGGDAADIAFSRLVSEEFRGLDEAAIKNKVVVLLTPEVNRYIEQLFADQAFYVNQLPDPLPTTYPVALVLDRIEQQIMAIRQSQTREVLIDSYDRVLQVPNALPVGALATQQQQMMQLVQQMDVDELASKIAVTASVVAYGAGAVYKLATFTRGNFSFETIFWGRIDRINQIASNVDDFATYHSIPTKAAIVGGVALANAQFPTQLAQRLSIFRDTGVLLLDASSQLPSLRSIAADTTVQVESIDTPSPVAAAEELTATGTGTITLNNTSAQPVTVRVDSRIVARVGGGMGVVSLALSEPKVIAAGTHQAVSFTYQLPRSTLIDPIGYTLHSSVIVAQGAISTRLGPFISHIVVGTQEQIIALQPQQFAAVARSSLDVGTQASHALTFASNTTSGHVLLSFDDDADLDLHLYDSQGRHVGRNETTGEIEVNIPGARYSGTNANPEWIEIPDPGIANYTAVVTDRVGVGNTTYDLSLLEAHPLPLLIDAPQHVLWSVARTEPSEALSIQGAIPVTVLGASAEQTTLVVQPSDLIGPNEQRIAAADVQCQTKSDPTSGFSYAVVCSADVPSHLPLGDYQGVIGITAQVAGAAPLNLSAHVTARLVDGQIRVLLPVVRN